MFAFAIESRQLAAVCRARQVIEQHGGYVRQRVSAKA
jgi:hypothetical protein